MYICICEQVTDKQIKGAIEAGANTLRDLRSELGVASQCGRCGNCAKKLLNEHGCRSGFAGRHGKLPSPSNVVPGVSLPAETRA